MGHPRLRRAFAYGLVPVALAAACEETDPVNVEVNPPPSLVLTGDRQSGVAGERLPQDLVVGVGFGGTAFAGGVPIRLTVVEGDGTLRIPGRGLVSGSGATLHLDTGPTGMVTVEVTLGTRAGLNIFSIDADMAGLVDDVRTVYADGLPGPVARVLRSGDGQLGLPDTRLPFDIMLVLQDRFGNAVGGVDVDWSVSAGDGSIDPAQLASDGHGAARTAWTLGPSLGAQALDGDVVGLGRFRFVSTAVGSAAESGAWSPPTLAFPLPVR